MEESGLFDEHDVGSAPTSIGASLEERLDEFVELAKATTQLAGRLRTNLNTMSQSAQTGKVGHVAANIERISSGITDLSSHVQRLGEAERSLGLRGDSASTAELVRELNAELGKRNIRAMKGPDPYWLVYPAWFTVQRNTRGVLEVVLNGERLESVRPSEVASRIVEVVNEKFQAKKFANLLLAVRDLLRRAGANNPTLILDDVYGVLAMGSDAGTRQKTMTKESFYYSIHRLAEELETDPAPAMDFPAANRSDHMFFTKHGETRKYLSVDFAAAVTR